MCGSAHARVRVCVCVVSFSFSFCVAASADHHHPPPLPRPTPSPTTLALWGLSARFSFFFCLIVFTPLCFPKVGRKIHNHNYVCNDGVDDVHDNDDAVSILHAQRQSVLRPMARCCWRWHSIPNESYERCSLCTAVLAECLQSFELCTAPVLNRWNRGLHALPHVGAVCTHRRQRVHDDRSVVGNHGHKPGAVLPT